MKIILDHLMLAIFICYNLYVFDIRYQKNFENDQPINVEIILSGNFDAGTYGYALVLTNKLISLRTDGQRHFDIS